MNRDLPTSMQPTNFKGMKYCIFGGSFNPIHVGHLAVVQAALQQLDIDALWLLVSAQNPWKAQDGLLLADSLRYKLAQMAVKTIEKVYVSDVEFQLPKPSYTWHTLQYLFSQYPHDEFSLLIGADNWVAFDRWYHYEDILQHCPVVVYPRRGYPIDRASLPAGVTILDMPLCDVSSTEIRRCVAEHRPITHLVPPVILPFVEECYAQEGVFYHPDKPVSFYP